MDSSAPAMTFQSSMNSYLGSLESSKVRTLKELVEFNYNHAMKALPLSTVRYIVFLAPC